jgi:hypothetical protein
MAPNENIAKNCWLLFQMSLKASDDLSDTAELSCDSITAHRTEIDAADAAAMTALTQGDQNLRSYIIVEGSELKITLRSRPPLVTDEQDPCTCENSLTFGLSQTCLSCGGFVPKDEGDDEVEVG